MRVACLVGFVVLLTMPQALASHASGTLPSLAGSGDQDPALSWMASQVQGGVCPSSAECSANVAKWTVLAVAHAGVDPARWPHADASILSALTGDPGRADEGSSNPTQGLALAVLAWTAAGRDAREASLPGGGSRDLVADLLATHDGFQFGDPMLVNDDVFALLALAAVEHGGQQINASLDFVLNHQRVDGSFPWRVGGEAEVDSTAAAVMALARFREARAVSSAVSYLDQARIIQGAEAACWGQQAGSAANAESTAWVLQALVAAGLDPVDWRVGQRLPVDCLRGFRTGGGGFSHVRGGPVDFMATVQVVAALGWAPYGSLRQPMAQEVRSSSTDGGAVAVRPESGYFRVGFDAREEVVVEGRGGVVALHGFSMDPWPHALLHRVERPEAISAPAWPLAVLAVAAAVLVLRGKRS